MFFQTKMVSMCIWNDHYGNNYFVISSVFLLFKRLSCFSSSIVIGETGQVKFSVYGEQYDDDDDDDDDEDDDDDDDDDDDNNR